MTRDQFLTEKMGECWHVGEGSDCDKCGFDTYNPDTDTSDKVIYWNNDFSTWEGFGKLWEWAKEQPMFEGLLAYNAAPNDMYTLVPLINPDRFTNAVAHFLGWEG